MSRRAAPEPGERRVAGRFAAIERFCLFVGQPRSGHSVVGTLVNAHPHAVVSHNLDALSHVRAGIARDDLFELILARDRWLAERGRRIGGYSYDVPGLWQSDQSRIRVIGDKRAGATSRHLAQEPELLRELPDRLGLPVCAIHHVRNPWDNISSIWSAKTLGRERSLPEAVDHYFEMLDAAVAGLSRAGDVRWLRTHHEDLIREPRAVLARVFAALGLEGEPAFLDACAGFVHGAPRRTRHDAPWTPDLVAAVGVRSKAYDFLGRYAFGDL